MQHFRFEPADEDGMTNIRAHAPIEELAPLFRALMRVEASMLLRDAEDFPYTEESCRTDDQRRCDALAQISQQLTEVLRHVGPV
jgi:hypothetical protein